VVSHIFGVLAVGWWKYLNKFINIHAFLEIPKKIKKDPMIILVNPIKAFVSLIEVVGELAKIASLSFRLFGNIFAGEVLLSIMIGLIPLVVPSVFYGLELFVGFIQAFVFVLLSAVFLKLAGESHAEH